jgi:hypothetical protein
MALAPLDAVAIEEVVGVPVAAAAEPLADADKLELADDTAEAKALDAESSADTNADEIDDSTDDTNDPTLL